MTATYQLHKYIGWADNGSHDFYYFVNLELGPQVLKHFHGDDDSEIVALPRTYTSNEVAFLESMERDGVFLSGNGDCITIVRVDSASDIAPYEVSFS